MWTVLRFHPRTLQFRILVTLACLSALCSLLLRRRSLNRVAFLCSFNPLGSRAFWRSAICRKGGGAEPGESPEQVRSRSAMHEFLQGSTSPRHWPPRSRGPEAIPTVVIG